MQNLRDTIDAVLHLASLPELSFADVAALTEAARRAYVLAAQAGLVAHLPDAARCRAESDVVAGSPPVLLTLLNLPGDWLDVPDPDGTPSEPLSVPPNMLAALAPPRTPGTAEMLAGLPDDEAGPATRRVFAPCPVGYWLETMRGVRDLAALDPIAPPADPVPAPTPSGPTLLEQTVRMVGDENAARILVLANRTDLSGNEKMGLILALDDRMEGKTAPEWATLLGVSDGAIRGYKTWQKLRSDLKRRREERD